jgi:hypothetical protein
MKRKNKCKEYEFIIKHCEFMILNLHIKHQYDVFKQLIEEDKRFVEKIPLKLYSVELCKMILQIAPDAVLPDEYKQNEEIVYFLNKIKS